MSDNIGKPERITQNRVIDLFRDELKYRYFFAIGAAVNTAIDPQGLALVGSELPNLYEDPRGIVSRLVRFAAAGMKAPLDPSSDNGDHPDK